MGSSGKRTRAIRPVATGPWLECGRPADGRPRRRLVLATGSSDSHTWNLYYLQLLLEELGHDVVNLGPCTPVSLVVSICSTIRPDLVVVSSVNGHGQQDGLALVRALRTERATAGVPAVIGGKLAVDQLSDSARQALLAGGYTAVFDDKMRTGADHAPSARVALAGVLDDLPRPAEYSA